MELLGFTITKEYPVLPLKEKTVINTINPHSYCVTRRDAAFREALQDSDLLLPDGIGIVWAAKKLKGVQIEKIAGFDIFIHIMKHLNETSGSVFFLGAAQKTLDLIHDKAAVDFPNVTVNSYSPPYKATFTEEDSARMCDETNKHKPDALFVGMTAPKQEKWVQANKQRLDAGIICSIGAVFDFYAGSVVRPSAFWINLGLEWLPRFLKEPRRLAERNLVSTPKFISEVMSYKLIKKPVLKIIK